MKLFGFPGSPSDSIAVAYSGGADSTALLLKLVRQHPGQVQAIHIHHGLQPAADDFAAHCQAFCAALAVPLHVVHVDATAQTGQSPEDAARRARYSALLSTVLDINTPKANEIHTLSAIYSIAIAQHADDQIETLLLALSRGAGLPGLSGMPERWQRGGVDGVGGVQFVRPLLGMTSHEIRLYLADCGLVARHPGGPNIGHGWVEDPTNRDLKFTRNRIRHELIPALEKTFPQFRQTFARSARHAAKANDLLTQLAIEDIAIVGLPPQIAALQALATQRQANALRYWLKSSHQVSPSAAQLAELQLQIAHCTHPAKQLRIKVASGRVERSGDVLEYLP